MNVDVIWSGNTMNLPLQKRMWENNDAKYLEKTKRIINAKNGKNDPPPQFDLKHVEK